MATKYPLEPGLQGLFRKLLNFEKQNDFVWMVKAMTVCKISQHVTGQALIQSFYFYVFLSCVSRKIMSAKQSQKCITIHVTVEHAYQERPLSVDVNGVWQAGWEWHIYRLEKVGRRVRQVVIVWLFIL